MLSTVIHNTVSPAGQSWVELNRRELLKNLAAFIEGHGYSAHVDTNAVAFRRHGGLVWVKSYAEARQALGLEG